ncbi:GNAT family N-acetyltransferase [Kibdelosporangium lantanae]
MSDVRPIGPDDWRTYRDIRLAALADAPMAFGSSLAREREFTESVWRRRLTTARTFLGYVADKPLAVAAGLVLPDGDAELIAVWAHPSARGTGLGEAVVRAVMTWAQAYPRLWATVASTNPGAERLYARLGFERSGITQPNPHDPDVVDHRLVVASP